MGLFVNSEHFNVFQKLKKGFKMDFTNAQLYITGQVAGVFAAALIVVAGYAALWAISLVINIFKDRRDPNNPDNYDHDVFK